MQKPKSLKVVRLHIGRKYIQKKEVGAGSCLNSFLMGVDRFYSLHAKNLQVLPSADFFFK